MMHGKGMCLRAFLLVAAGTLLCGASHLPTISPSASGACMAQSGYADVERDLRSAVADRDGAKLRALFHPDGRMRVNGIGGTASTPDWSFDSPAAGEMWGDLATVLTLGCARDGERLVLPALAVHAKREISTEAVVTLAPVALRRAPQQTAPVTRRVSAGRVLTMSIPEVRPGWSELLVGARRLYVPSKLLRSPYATRIELARDGERWRIIWIGSGI